MKYKKKYQGNLYIGKNKIYLDTDIKIRTLVIEYLYDLKITNKKNLLINKGDNKIIISNVGENLINPKSTLFEYKGKAIITRCKVFSLGRTIHTLRIHKTHLELWNTLGKSQVNYDNEISQQDWAYLTRNWEDLNYDGNNSKKPYIFKKTFYDNEAKQHTTIKEIRKK